MRVYSTLAITLLVVAVGTQLIHGQQARQQTNRDVAKGQLIHVGTSVRMAKLVLDNAKVVPAGTRAFSAHPDGDRWLFYSIRKSQVELVVQYSPKTQRVTGLMLFYLGLPKSKSSDIPIPATAIQFHKDGSYSVRFPPASRSK